MHLDCPWGSLPVTSAPPIASGHPSPVPLAATMGALGVVYGDIGTSPLYALKEAAKAAAHDGPLAPEAVLGVASLILWSLILLFYVKDVLLLLGANNRGKGGLVPLLALLPAPTALPGTWRAQLLVV